MNTLTSCSAASPAQPPCANPQTTLPPCLRSLYRTRLARLTLLAALGAGMVGSLSACLPVVAGAMVGGVMVLSDRRTVGTQAEDQSIEFKVSNQISANVSKDAHVSVTSFNRMVLLTGEVPTQAEKDKLVAAAKLVPNIRSVHDETQVAPAASLSQQSSDTVLTTKVKSSFVDQPGLKADSIKVVTERSVVYLMGLVTSREAELAGKRAATVPGVAKVVKVFEIVSDAELLRIQPPPPPPASAPPPSKLNLGAYPNSTQ